MAAVIVLMILAGARTQALPAHLERATATWDTDFSISSIDLRELVVGLPAGDPRDVIAPLDDPSFQDIPDAGIWLEDDEPGVMVEVGAKARFYPLRVLNRHEIVNDTIGGRRLVVTYCPLCNSAVVFDPDVDGEPLRFGTSGLLRHSDLVMWDDRTESLWQQLGGEAIVGELTGTRLERVPSRIVRWIDFAQHHPHGDVLGRNQGRKVLYGDNPYVGYSGRQGPIGAFFDSPIDPRLPALERVVGVEVGDSRRAVAFSLLVDERVIELEVGGQPVVVLWGAPATTDALDGFTVAGGDPIGTAIAYSAKVDGRRLTFEPAVGDAFVDHQTRSRWSLLGKAESGPLDGHQLEVVVHTNEFWFAWQSFNDPEDLFER